MKMVFSYLIYIHDSFDKCGKEGMLINKGDLNYNKGDYVSNIDESLSDFADQEVVLELRVISGKDNENDWAAWISPTITGSSD